jgi:pimeloyl-ACP methyl ester carboxylesterase
MPPLLDALGRGGVPVVFAVGALDRRAVSVARGAMGALPRAEVVVVPDAGHNLVLEAPSVVASLVVEISSSRLREGTERRTA